jgi:hypothetical protein
MKTTRKQLAAAAIALAVLAAAAFLAQKPAEDCKALATAFDANIDSIAARCDAYFASDGRLSLPVGGTLLNVTTAYSESYGRYEHYMTFKGLAKTGTFGIATQNATPPYATGRFYKFDFYKNCDLLYSAASSGLYTGRLEQFECKAD